jgi:hypothetical protein
MRLAWQAAGGWFNPVNVDVEPPNALDTVHTSRVREPHRHEGGSTSGVPLSRTSAHTLDHETPNQKPCPALARSRVDSVSPEVYDDADSISLTWDSTAINALSFLESVEKNNRAHKAAAVTDHVVPPAAPPSTTPLRRRHTTHLLLPAKSMDCMYTPPGTPQSTRKARPPPACVDGHAVTAQTFDSPNRPVPSVTIGGEPIYGEYGDTLITTPTEVSLVDDFSRPSWLLVDAPREEVHRWAVRLMRTGPIGSFLVRTPSSRPDHYALVLKVAERSVKNFLIRRSPNDDRVSLSGIVGDTLMDLVHRLTTDVEGALPVCLLRGFDLDALQQQPKCVSSPSPRHARSNGDDWREVTCTSSVDKIPDGGPGRLVGSQFLSPARLRSNHRRAPVEGTPVSMLSKADFTLPTPVLPSRSEEDAEIEMVATAYATAIPPPRAASSPLSDLPHAVVSPGYISCGPDTSTIEDEEDEIRMVADAYNQVISRIPSSPDDGLVDSPLHLQLQLPPAAAANIFRATLKIADLVTEQAHGDSRQPIFIATHPFVPKAENEIALTVGTRVAVLQTPTGGWWQGTTAESGCTAVGWFPSSHVATPTSAVHLGVDTQQQRPCRRESALTTQQTDSVSQPVTRFDSADSSVDMDGTFDDSHDDSQGGITVAPPPGFA